MRIGPFVCTKKVTVGIGLEEGVVDSIVFDKVDVVRIGEFVAVVPLPTINEKEGDKSGILAFLQALTIIYEILRYTYLA